MSSVVQHERQRPAHFSRLRIDLDASSGLVDRLAGQAGGGEESRIPIASEAVVRIEANRLFESVSRRPPIPVVEESHLRQLHVRFDHAIVLCNRTGCGVDHHRARSVEGHRAVVPEIRIAASQARPRDGESSIELHSLFEECARFTSAVSVEEMEHEPAPQVQVLRFLTSDIRVL